MIVCMPPVITELCDWLIGYHVVVLSNAIGSQDDDAHPDLLAISTTRPSAVCVLFFFEGNQSEVISRLPHLCRKYRYSLSNFSCQSHCSLSFFIEIVNLTLGIAVQEHLLLLTFSPLHFVGYQLEA